MEIIEWVLQDKPLIGGLFSLVAAILGIFGRQLQSYHKSLESFKTDLIECHTERAKMVASMKTLDQKIRILDLQNSNLAECFRNQSVELRRLKNLEKKYFGV